MIDSVTELTTDLLKTFHPLVLVPDSRLGALIEGGDIVRLKRNQFLFKKAPPPDTCFFLIEGDIEVRESFNVRHKVTAGSDQAGFALEEHCSEGASVRALSDVSVLTLQRDDVDLALASDKETGYDIHFAEDSEERLEEVRFDDDYSEDWMVKVLESVLMSYLSASDIQRCFIELERVTVDKGEEIVTAGSRGDFFYLLMAGEAQVLTESGGPYEGAIFDLEPGDYFGEESLIADTIRNATVRMTSKGVVGRLGREQFDSIFRKAMVQSIALEKARSFLGDAGIAYQLLDVRFPPEYRHAHIEESRNLPIVMLRKSLRELDRNCTYLITPEGGRRSELAVFLLRQEGLQAYLLED